MAVIEEIEYIHEPLSEYKNRYKDKHKENVEEYFNNLLEESKVNVEENRETVKHIRKLELELTNFMKKIANYELLRVLFVLLIFGSVVVAAKGISNMTQGLIDATSIIMTVTGGVAFGLVLFLLIKKLNPKIK